MAAKMSLGTYLRGTTNLLETSLVAPCQNLSNNVLKVSTADISQNLPKSDSAVELAFHLSNASRSLQCIKPLSSFSSNVKGGSIN